MHATLREPINAGFVLLVVLWNDDALESLRPALLNRARALVGADDADDLVQETLLVALSRVQDNRPVADAIPWIFGVLRTLAKRRRTQRYNRREEALGDDLPDEISDDDPLNALLAAERGALLDQAFVALDAPARSLLTARFVDETPMDELAQRLGVTPNAAFARLHRARGALQDVLSHHLHETAAAHGLITPAAADGWVTTTIYCPRCGDSFLQGRLDRGSLSLRCPLCDTNGVGLAGLSTRVAPLPGAAVLAGASGFRVALRRVNSWWHDYLHDGLRSGSARCVHCGQPTTVTRQDSDSGAPGFHTACLSCRRRFVVAPAGLLLHDPLAQAFWSRNARLRYLPSRSIVYAGHNATRIAFVSRRSAARIEAVYDSTTLERLHLEIDE